MPKEKPIKEGQILKSTWGYEQTNVDFYLVTKLTPKGTATLQKVEATREGYSAQTMSGTSRPNRRKRLGAPFNRRVVKHAEYGEWVRIESYANAYPWDGQPVRFTTYA